MDRMIRIGRAPAPDRNWMRASIHGRPGRSHPLRAVEGARMKPIRIALGRMPRLLRDILVQVLGSERDMTIVGEAAEPAEFEALLERAPADVVIFDGGAATEAESRRLLGRHQDLKVLALSGDGRSAALRWLEPSVTTCSEVSPDTLVRLIRSTCRPEA
jgi:DNA-binding NarL/FixJ family response regulator